MSKRTPMRSIEKYVGIMGPFLPVELVEKFYDNYIEASIPIWREEHKKKFGLNTYHFYNYLFCKHQHRGYVFKGLNWQIHRNRPLDVYYYDYSIETNHPVKVCQFAHRRFFLAQYDLSGEVEQVIKKGGYDRNLTEYLEHLDKASKNIYKYNKFILTRSPYKNFPTKEEFIKYNRVDCGVATFRQSRR